MEPRAVMYLLFNLASVCGVVFANKAVFKVFNFNFAYALTWIHAIATMFGMHAFQSLGMYKPKKVPKHKLLLLTCLYVGYIVFGNLNLKFNTVGFYQISKLVIAPVTLFLEVFFITKVFPSYKIMIAVLVVCSGVGISTVTDGDIGTNLLGLSVGVGAILSSAAYTVWISKMKKELDVSSMQLLNEYAPMAVALLGTCTFTLEPVGWLDRKEDTLLGFNYNLASLSMITLSACLGLLVSLSTFLFIGVTSALTYNVVGHLKTLFIVTGGVIIFGEQITLKKAVGIAVAMGGIIWYNELKKHESKQAQEQKKEQENGGTIVRENGKGNAFGQTKQRKPYMDGQQLVFYDLKSNA
eukprot:TRINITY_DN3381_c0_g1_i10.p1 TRINITY_DN3381_c0_g1~~TRINITY_DN3381_c0_g1_i10.p1  ORF type:complete len:353 (-),score=36.90 TRINITY_DN3381_c0_g1_i10:1317-2375(-)